MLLLRSKMTAFGMRTLDGGFDLDTCQASQLDDLQKSLILVSNEAEQHGTTSDRLAQGHNEPYEYGEELKAGHIKFVQGQLPIHWIECLLGKSPISCPSREAISRLFCIKDLDQPLCFRHVVGYATCTLIQSLLKSGALNQAIKVWKLLNVQVSTFGDQRSHENF